MREILSDIIPREPTKADLFDNSTTYSLFELLPSELISPAIKPSILIVSALLVRATSRVSKAPSAFLK